MENTIKNQTQETKNLEAALAKMLEGENQELDCTSGVCVIKGDKSLVERINKKIITEDGRQLLF